MDSRLGSLGASLALVLGLGTLLWSLNPTHAQDAATASNAPGGAASQPGTGWPQVPDHVRPQMYYPQQRRSIVHHYPYPYPGYYHNDDTAGFRNPGGVGRHAEYYPPGDQFQTQGDPVRVARFGVGRLPQPVGTARGPAGRHLSLQLDPGAHRSDGRCPDFGYGFGVGGFGGFW